MVGRPPRQYQPNRGITRILTVFDPFSTACRDLGPARGVCARDLAAARTARGADDRASAGLNTTAPRANLRGASRVFIGPVVGRAFGVTGRTYDVPHAFGGHPKSLRPHPLTALTLGRDDAGNARLDRGSRRTARRRRDDRTATGARSGRALGASPRPPRRGGAPRGARPLDRRDGPVPRGPPGGPGPARRRRRRGGCHRALLRRRPAHPPGVAVGRRAKRVVRERGRVLQRHRVASVGGEVRRGGAALRRHRRRATARCRCSPSGTR